MRSALVPGPPPRTGSRGQCALLQVGRRTRGRTPIERAHKGTLRFATRARERGRALGPCPWGTAVAVAWKRACPPTRCPPPRRPATARHPSPPPPHGRPSRRRQLLEACAVDKASPARSVAGGRFWGEAGAHRNSTTTAPHAARPYRHRDRTIICAVR